MGVLYCAIVVRYFDFPVIVEKDAAQNKTRPPQIGVVTVTCRCIVVYSVDHIFLHRVTACRSRCGLSSLSEHD